MGVDGPVTSAHRALRCYPEYTMKTMGKAVKLGCTTQESSTPQTYVGQRPQPCGRSTSRVICFTFLDQPTNLPTHIHTYIRTCTHTYIHIFFSLVRGKIVLEILQHLRQSEQSPRQASLLGRVQSYRRQIRQIAQAVRRFFLDPCFSSRFGSFTPRPEGDSVEKCPDEQSAMAVNGGSIDLHSRHFFVQLPTRPTHSRLYSVMYTFIYSYSTVLWVFVQVQ